MDIRFFTIRPRTNRKEHAADDLLDKYTDRIGHFCRVQTENVLSEEKFRDALQRHSTRSSFILVLLDSRGRSFTSEEFAGWLQTKQTRGAQQIFFAVGPPDGWTTASRERAEMLLSLGPMTLPHELAAIVLAEQIYRAFTILAGHPYHLGHAEGGE